MSHWDTHAEPMSRCYYCRNWGREKCRSLLRRQCLKFPQTPYDPPMIYPLYAVYALFNEHGYLVYVGRTTNLTNRIQEHWHDLHKHFFLWDYLPFETASQQRDVEAALIQRFRPKYNKFIPRLNEMADDSDIVDAIKWLNHYVCRDDAWRIEHADFWRDLKAYLHTSQDQIA